MIVKSNFLFSQSRVADSLRNLLAKTSNDSAQIKLLDQIVKATIKNDTVVALSSARQAIEIAVTSGKQSNLASAYDIARYYYNKMGKLDSSMRYAQLMLEAANKDKNDYWITESYFQIGRIQSLQHNNQSAIASFLAALNAAENTGDAERRAKICEQLIFSYENLENYNKALEYVDLELELLKTTRDSLAIADALMEKGVALSMNLQLEEAIPPFNEAREIYKKMNDKRGEIYITNDLGITYKKLGRFTEALAQYRMGLQLADKIGMEKEQIYQIWINAGNVFTKLHQYDSANFYLSQSLNFGLKTGNVETMMEGYRGLYQLQSATGDYKSALDNYEKYIAIRDTILKTENNKTLAEIQTKYESEKKDREIELLNKTNLLKTQQAQHQKFFTYILLTGAIILLIIALLLWNRYQIKQRANTKLKHMLLELRKTQEQLIHSEKMASLGHMAASIAHEIKNPLNFVTNFSELSQTLMEEIQEATTQEQKMELQDDLRRNLEKINHHGKRADDIVRNMLMHSRTGGGEKQSTDINTMCSEFIDLAYHGMRANVPGFSCRIEKKLSSHVPNVDVIAQDISRMLLNLFNNAFHAVYEKSGKADSENKISGEQYHPLVMVSTELKDHTLIIRVRDNGSGIPRNLREKIFEPFFTTKPPGQGTGLGLSISYDIVKTHGGEMKVVSVENEFTEFTITLPVN